MNLNLSNHAPLVALLGPTAVGKTSLSLSLAERFEIEIISADSRLFYRGLDIGTAKPSGKEQEAVPHHLIDVTTPDQPWSLADFRQAAYLAIDGVHARGNLPLLVGGTGQYISALLEGWQPPPKSESDSFRKDLEAVANNEGSQALHARLAKGDPLAAEQIDHRNIRRVIRALEIIELTGKPASAQRIKQAPPYRILRIGLSLPRVQLYSRIDARIEAMLNEGWENEVRQLLDQGYDFSSAPFSAIGYRQIASYVRDEISFEQAKAEIKRLTRQFVRRQANWFKSDDDRIHWYENSTEAIEEISALITQWLGEKNSNKKIY
jgi:tRNA dimethylallyltransferase